MVKCYGYWVALGLEKGVLEARKLVAEKSRISVINWWRRYWDGLSQGWGQLRREDCSEGGSKMDQRLLGEGAIECWENHARQKKRRVRHNGGTESNGEVRSQVLYGRLGTVTMKE